MMNLKIHLDENTNNITPDVTEAIKTDDFGQKTTTQIPGTTSVTQAGY